MNNQSLKEVQIKAGAVFERLESGVEAPATFGNDPAALKAVQDSVVIYDQSHWGWIQVSDADRIRFLHNQSTNDFNSLKAGQGCETVFVTSTARTIDLATAYILEEAVLLKLSPNRRSKILQWLDRYIFFADKVKLTDVTEQTAAFSIMGPQSSILLEQLNIKSMSEFPPHAHQIQTIKEIEVRVAVGCGLATPGYTVIVEAENAAKLWKIFTEAGAIPLGETAWNHLRIQQGRPIPEQELTEDYNPLEAGLWHAISLNKGCYIGQETIARLNTYKGVKQNLWGIHLTGKVEPGTAITMGEEKVGILTSCIETDSGALGLAYIRSKAGGAGLKVKVGETAGEVVEVPFLTRDPAQSE